MFIQIIKGTPPWVWLLLAGLVALGATQLRDREVSRTRLLILPIAMVLLSLLSTASAFQLSPAAMLSWILGGTLALAASPRAIMPSVNGRGASGFYRIAGSWWPLILILCIFSVRYVVNVTLAIDPSWRGQAAFQTAVGLLSGIFAGVFLARAMAALGIARAGALLRWGAGVAMLMLLPLVAALALIAWPAPGAETETAKPAQELEAFVKSAPKLEPAPARYFKARDGADRLYRQYDGAGLDALIFFHGSTADSRYLAPFARRIASETGLTVITPDMRGHGPSPVRRGDVDDAEQQQRDLADLISALRERNFKRVVFGGHSLGGGLAIRYAASGQTPRPDGLVLLAPFINADSPAARPGSGGWATANVPRFIGLSIFHRYGIGAFDSLPVLRFRTPDAANDGSETTVYSWRLWSSVTPGDWRADIQRLKCPILVIGAARDVIFRSEGYGEVFASAQHAQVQIVPDIGHFDLVANEDVIARIAAWTRAQK